MNKRLGARRHKLVRNKRNGRPLAKDTGRGRRIGRPPAGARAGERVKDYPQVSIRIPEDVRAMLNALAEVTSLAQWRVIVNGIRCYLRELPPQQKRLVEARVARMLKMD